ncbi:fast skeletal myosin light chain 2 [Nematocida homosporus]|uniref:fast skeletal myosin light chain 2 n=1 Tax=Nematocida homosporus TaxID=1912981 RepID=UPI00221E8703|nr:fast skeletal myosin light chain 2 [Nematocida homosporus]KAI5186317.1 fast skeletal myosin light chain 2 [Nematocida homosporus]
MELKDIFNMLDVTTDGNVSRQDLETFLEDIGAPLTNEEITSMMDDMGDRFTFTLFLTTLCERLSNIDSENVIASALQVLDPSESGLVAVTELEAALCQSGGVSAEEWQALERLLKPSEGRVAIKDLAKTIRHCGLALSE